LKRRDFLWQGSLLGTGFGFGKFLPRIGAPEGNREGFKDPAMIDRPFVRWWWNGDKIEKSEIVRELQLLKRAGMGGVEINPIKFPLRANDMSEHSVKWLSPEWVELLQFTLAEARSLGLTCDLIAGSGWPFGAEWLEGDERSQLVAVAVKKLAGPREYEVSVAELFREADPGISSPYTGRTMELLSLYLVPSPLDRMEDIKDITGMVADDKIRVSIGEGGFAVYGLVLIHGFMEVINGAPGAEGAVLNHYNAVAVKKYLFTISAAIGPVSGKIRSLFTDSLELEGANWCNDMAAEFNKRKGYDLLPSLPFILFKIGGMGNTIDFHYGIEFGAELKEKLDRVRYDFESVKTELLQERFVGPFKAWCKENGVQSRMQAYGRGYHPLDGSFGVDIPECETWIKKGLGTEMGEADYRIGRAYTMINKYVSSAAHLGGKSIVSCEELTDIGCVFSSTLELLKIASDQSIISGVTHAVFHGFNYSPAAAAFPGWVRYGTFFNERNPWWPYISYFTTYRARLAGLLQQGVMYADIAILTPIADMWSIYGAQNEPFPSLVYPGYLPLIWEAIHKNGNGCDYVSEKVIRESECKDGYLYFGPRKYRCIFLIETESIEPATAKKLHAFIEAGGRVFCLEKYPGKSAGWGDHGDKDEEVRAWTTKMKHYPDRFIFLKKPADHYIDWFREIQEQFQLEPYVRLDKPNPFVNQIRYQGKDAEMIYLINSNMKEGYPLTLSFANTITGNRQGWLWDVETGEKYKLPENAGRYVLDLGPAASALIVFDMERRGQHTERQGQYFKALPLTGDNRKSIDHWAVEWQHIDGSIQHTEMEELKDIQDIPEFSAFCGTVIYRATAAIRDPRMVGFLNAGGVSGLCELAVNGINCGVRWFGRRIYPIGDLLKKGDNLIEIKVITSMTNYLKTLKDNPVAQYWTNEKERDQPIQSMGLLGPVTIY